MWLYLTFCYTHDLFCYFVCFHICFWCYLIPRNDGSQSCSHNTMEMLNLVLSFLQFLVYISQQWMERIEEQQHYLFHSIMKLLPKSRSPCIVDICDKTPILHPSITQFWYYLLSTSLCIHFGSIYVVAHGQYLLQHYNKLTCREKIAP